MLQLLFNLSLQFQQTNKQTYKIKGAVYLCAQWIETYRNLLKKLDLRSVVIAGINTH